MSRTFARVRRLLVMFFVGAAVLGNVGTAQAAGALPWNATFRYGDSGYLSVYRTYDSPCDRLWSQRAPLTELRFSGNENVGTIVLFLDDRCQQPAFTAGPGTWTPPRDVRYRSYQVS